jgi:hypothetical protein
MTSFLIAAAVLAAAPDAELKSFHVYQDEVRDALRRESTAESPGRRAAAIRDLAGLYDEISSDPRLATSDTLTEMRNKLWSRLTSIKRDLERQIARDEKDAAKRAPRQQQAKSPGEEDNENEAALALAARLARMTYSLDGPGSLAAGNEAAFGGGAVVGDWGPALVNLIERTIAPEKWDTVGGPFSIVYFAPLKVLVVRATAEVHHDVGGVVGGLRRVGR